MEYFFRFLDSLLSFFLGVGNVIYMFNNVIFFEIYNNERGLFVRCV